MVKTWKEIQDSQERAAVNPKTVTSSDCLVAQFLYTLNPPSIRLESGYTENIKTEILIKI